MPTSARSYAAVRMIPTSAGTTALIGDPGPTYQPRSSAATKLALDSIGRTAVFMEWPFPETQKAKARRMLLLVARFATAAYGLNRVAREAARTGRALARLHDAGPFAHGGIVRPHKAV